MASQKQNFVDQHMRPIIEILEKLSIQIDLAEEQKSLLNPALADDSTPYDDGRPNENLDQFTEGNILTMMSGSVTFNEDTLKPAAALIRTIAVRSPV